METQAIPGKVTVEPEVLETIARFTALNVPGVVRIVETDVDRLLGLTGKSVVVEVAEGKVSADLHIIAGPDISLVASGACGAVRGHAGDSEYDRDAGGCGERPY